MNSGFRRAWTAFLEPRLLGMLTNGILHFESWLWTWSVFFGTATSVVAVNLECFSWNRDFSRGCEVDMPHQPRMNSGFRGAWVAFLGTATSRNANQWHSPLWVVAVKLTCRTSPECRKKFSFFLSHALALEIRGSDEPELLFWNRDFSRGCEVDMPHQPRMNSGFRRAWVDFLEPRL